MFGADIHYYLYGRYTSPFSGFVSLPYHLCRDRLKIEIYPFSRPTLRVFQKFKRACSNCFSLLVAGGEILTHETGICAQTLPSVFSAAIRHSAGRSAASFLILDIYQPCEKDTVARLLSFVNSMQFSMFPDISAIEISFTSTLTLSAIRSAASSDAKPFSRILRKDFSESPVPPAGGVPFPPP